MGRPKLRLHFEQFLHATALLHLSIGRALLNVVLLDSEQVLAIRKLDYERVIAKGRSTLRR
ncbi:MAG: hypothetical protein JWP08_107, partial [Bryobacterales bacterium]|nr:hypothetical protein [Bryobacterales bacterium]